MGDWLARAKVNLALDIVGTRSDGFHELRTIFQSIDLADVVTVESADDISVVCDAPGVPDGPANLAYRAAAALRAHCGVDRGCRIAIGKRIPAGAGLGGGSADAAATLVALNELWRLQLGDAELLAIGGALGSDVPFMLNGGTCLASGRGELLAPLPCAGSFPVTVVMPPTAVPTPGAYRLFDAWPTPVHPDPQPAIAALAAGDWAALAGRLGNSFEAPIAAAYPPVAAALREIRAVLPATAGAVLSGSGAAIVTVGADSDSQAALRRRLPDCLIWSGSSASAGVSRLTAGVSPLTEK